MIRKVAQIAEGSYRPRWLPLGKNTRYTQRASCNLSKLEPTQSSLVKNVSGTLSFFFSHTTLNKKSSQDFSSIHRQCKTDDVPTTEMVMMMVVVETNKQHHLLCGSHPLRYIFLREKETKQLFLCNSRAKCSLSTCAGHIDTHIGGKPSAMHQTMVHYHAGPTLLIHRTQAETLFVSYECVWYTYDSSSGIMQSHITAATLMPHHGWIDGWMGKEKERHTCRFTYSLRGMLPPPLPLDQCEPTPIAWSSVRITSVCSMAKKVLTRMCIY